MPYGTETTYQPDATYTYANKYPGGQQVYTTNFTSNTRTQKSWFRSGGNKSIPIKDVKRLPRPKVFEKRLVTVFKGPLLSSTYFDTKYKKWRRARAPIQVWRTVRVWEKNIPKKKRIGLDLPPNPLYFYERVANGVAMSSSITSSYPGLPEWSRVFTGPLIHYPPWGDASGISTMEFTDSPISSFDRYGLFNEAESRLDTQAKNKLAEKCKNQSVNLAQFLNERRQTASLFAETATRLAKCLLQAKRGNLVGAAKYLFPTNAKQLANDVLMIDFGIKPLLSDLDGMAKHLAFNDTNERIVDIIASRREEIPYTCFEEVLRNPVRCLTTLEQYGSVEVRYKMRCRVALPIYNQLKELGFGNPATLVWESIPFSFVADWFLPIGSYINNLDAFDGYTVLHGSKTVFRRRTSILTRNYGGIDRSGYECGSKSISQSFDQVECQRSLMTAFPSLSLPSLKDPLSAGHILDATALFLQLKR